MPRKCTGYLASLVILSLTLSGCGVVVRQAHDAYQKVEAGSLRYQGRIAPLTAKELLWAKTAWRYFVNNTNADTGLVNSIDRYPIAGAWHMGDYLAALMAAHQLRLIDKIEFDQRLSRFLGFIDNMPLVQGKLPNKAYNTKTGQMMDASNRVGEVGWSAIDISRLMVWLKIIGEHYPEYHEYLDKVILRWQYCDIIDDCGQLYRYSKNGQTWHKQQEGRLGYEEYAGTGFALWGFNANSARRIKLDQRITVDNLQLLYDERDPRLTNTPNPILTMPYVFLGLEFGWQEGEKYSKYWPQNHGFLKQQAEMVYRVQEQRWLKDKIFTARTDHSLAVAPYQLLDSIYANGQAWNTLSENGQWYPKLSLVSTRAVFGLWVLWDTPYTNELMKITEALFDKDRGWYEGRYEASGAYERIITSHTNAAILEVLLYKTKGKLYQAKRREGYFNVKLDKIYELPQHCLPPERPACPL
jgi:hypothetical protein